MKRELIIRDCGLAEYGEILDLQQQLCQQRQDDEIENTVLLVEHPSVLTLGARKSENKLLTDEKSITDNSVQVIKVGRGGGTTAHNPGQIVLYPIIKLRSLKLGVNEYVRLLEAIGIKLLVELGVNAKRRKGFPGLWVEERKIGSIGVQVKRWVTFHGMAININNDLTIFDYIVPCGLEGVQMTSVKKETQNEISMQLVKEKLSRLCMKYFTGVE